MSKPKLIIFASGTKTGGGSGFQKLTEAARSKILDAEIVAVVSNHENGGVREKADRLCVPFIHFKGPFTAEEYQKIVRETDAEWVSLSGWLKLVAGLTPNKTMNIHPGLLPQFGGPGMYGHHVHEAVMTAYRAGKVTHSAVTMHFVTEKYDEGPIFFQMPVAIHPNDTAETLSKAVNDTEHAHQAWITNSVIHGRISWTGRPEDEVVGAEIHTL